MTQIEIIQKLIELMTALVIALQAQPVQPIQPPVLGALGATVSTGMVREMYMTGNSATIYMTDGVTWTMTKADVFNLYKSQTGSAATKKQKTIDLIKEDLKAKLGDGFNPDEFIADVDDLGNWKEIGFERKK